MRRRSIVEQGSLNRGMQVVIGGSNGEGGVEGANVIFGRFSWQRCLVPTQGFLLV